MPPIGLFIFFGVVALAVVVVRNAMRRATERRKLVQQHPAEPWMWRQDWADRAVRNKNSVSPAFLWMFAILWNLMTLPFIFFFRGQPERRLELLFVALFPLAGAILIVSAVYLSLRQRKYGVSLCRIHRLPISIGGVFQGEVEARVREVPPSGFQVRLTNVRRIVSGSGKHRSVRERILWQNEQIFGSGASMPTAEGMRIPVQLAIPADAEPTDDSNSRDSILWRLQVEADVPGIDYTGSFELPVYRTADLPDDRFKSASTPWTPPRNITFGHTAGGEEEITVRPMRSFGDWFGYLFFVAIWFSALEFMRRFGAPLWIVILFAIFGTIVFIAVADILLGRSKIVVRRDGLIARRTWLGLGTSRSIAIDDIESIAPKTGTTQGTRALYDVAVGRGGKRVTIARHLDTRRDADALAARITDSLARFRKFS